MKNVAIVEFHGFQDEKDSYIIKELAIVGSFTNINLIFKSPHSRDKIPALLVQTNSWLERDFHKIRWEDGIIRFSFSLMRNLLAPFDMVYTKGLQKKIFLSKFHSNVQELDDSWKVPLDFKVECVLPQHKFVSKCAIRSASYFYQKILKDV